MEGAVVTQVKALLGEILRLSDRSEAFDASTALFGSLPEFDSMAVVQVVLAMEERFGFAAEPDEITSEIFATVGSLASYVEGKLGTNSPGDTWCAGPES